MNWMRESGRIDVAQLLSYEDTTAAMLLFILDELHKNASTYDETKPFNSNLASFLNISGDTVTKTEADKKAILISLIEMDKLGTLATYLRGRVTSFNAIYSKEINRIACS